MAAYVTVSLSLGFVVVVVVVVVVVDDDGEKRSSLPNT